MSANLGILNKSRVGLYIDSQTICVAVLQSSAGGPRIAGHAEIPGTNSFEPNAQNNQRLLEKLKKAFELAGARSSSVNLVVPPEASMIRHFELPVMPKKEEKNAVRFETQKYVPFDMKELYFDHESHAASGKKRMNVVVFACKRQWVDQIAALLLLMGVRLERVELASQALMRGFRHRLAKHTEDAEAVVVPSDESNAELVFFRDRSVLLTRHLPLAAQTASDPAFLVSELRLSLDYFSENFKGEKIHRLHWAGGAGESTHALGETLSKQLSLPVENSDFLRALGNGQAGTAALAAAYGAALAGLKPEKGKHINLRPSVAVSAAPPANWPEEKKQLQDIAAKESVAIAAVLFVFYLLSLNFTSSRHRDLMDTMATYPKMMNADIAEPIVQLQDKYSQASAKLDFASNLIDKRAFFTVKMSRLADLVPSNIRLSMMEYMDHVDNTTGKSALVWRLEGYVRSEGGGELTAVNRFVDLLLSDEQFMQGFDDIRVASTKKTLLDETPATKFSLECTTSRKV